MIHAPVELWVVNHLAKKVNTCTYLQIARRKYACNSVVDICFSIIPSVCTCNIVWSIVEVKLSFCLVYRFPFAYSHTCILILRSFEIRLSIKRYKLLKMTYNPVCLWEDSS